MKSTGVVRKLDMLGRVVLPKELRHTMDLPEGAPMEIFTNGETIILKKYQPDCVFCRNMDGIQQFKGKNICSSCRQSLKG